MVARTTGPGAPLAGLAAVAARSFAGADEAVAAILGLARDLLGLSTALVTRFDGDTWQATHVDDAFGFAPGSVLPLSDAFCRLVAPGRPVVIDDAPNDARGRLVPAGERLGIRTFVGVPLVLRDGSLYGTLCALDRRPGAVDEEAVGALNILARLVVHELEHDRALTAVREAAERESAAKRLAEAERRERAGSAALLRAAVALNEASSLQALMTALATAAAEAVAADRVSVYAYDDARARTIAAGHYALGDPAGVHSVPAPLAAADGLPPTAIPAELEVLRTGRPLPRDEATPFPNPVQPDDWRSDIVVPLLAAGSVQGVLYAREVGVARVFAEEEVALLQAIGNQAGLAILRARDAAAAERRADYLALLNQVGHALAETLDVDELCAALHAELAKVLAVDACYVALYEEGDSQIWFPYLNDRGQRVPANWLPLGEGPTSRVLRSRQAVVIAPDRAPGSPRGLTFGDERRGAAALHVPLLRGDRLIGVLSVQRYDPVGYDAEDLRTVETIAQQAAAAFAHARLHAETVAARDGARRHAANLEAVLRVTRSIVSATELATVLDALARELAVLVPHHAIALYRSTPDGSRLHPVFARRYGQDFDASEWSLPVGAGLVGHAFANGVAELVNDAHLDPRSVYPGCEAAAYRAAGHHAAVAPLAVAGQGVGVLYLSRLGASPFTRDEFSLFRVLAEQTAAAIRNADLLARNRELYLGGIGALASAVDAKDPTVRGHSERVGRLAGRIAAAMGLKPADVEAVELAGLLHDVGKIGVPDAILQKPAPLDDAERAIVVGHAALGGELLARAEAEALRPLAPLVRHHHERVDGRGYPDGLAGDAIPLGAAIIAVADAFDSIVTDRPYRSGRSVAAAIAELRSRGGSQFRPDIVEALVDVAPAAVAARSLPFSSSRIGAEAARLDQSRDPRLPGQLGDTRALGLLVELATVTRHIPDLPGFLAQVARIVRRRLGYRHVALLLVDPDHDELVPAAQDGVLSPGHLARGRRLLAGIADDVVRIGRARNVLDIRREPAFADLEEPGGSALLAPLVVDDRTIGVIAVGSDRAAAFTAADEAVLAAVAGQVAAAIHVAQLHDVAKRAAATDGLTGLANHRAFYEALGKVTAADSILSVVLMDVEGLKTVNDSAGHLAGDALLRRVAETIRAAVRAEDLVARYGGDEFAVIMRGIGSREAARVAARVRHDLQEAGGAVAAVATVRYGVASLPEDGLRPAELVAAADRRLYRMRGRR